MQKILLATNGKESAKKAEEYAISLAVEKKLPLTVVYIRNSVWYRFSEEVDWLSTHRARKDFQKYMEEYTDAEEERLFSRLEKILTEKGVNFEMIALSGNPVDEIVNYSKDNNFDLIIVGEGKETVLRRLFGSTSSRIVKTARCKVAVIK